MERFIKHRDDVKEHVFNSSGKNSLAVEENYTVTAAVLPILADTGFRFVFKFIYPVCFTTYYTK